MHNLHLRILGELLDKGKISSDILGSRMLALIKSLLLSVCLLGTPR